MNYDFTASLPTSPLLLEASAGTGKTWTIATLTARFLAEQEMTIDQVLLITFTDKAARDLRSGVFRRLQNSERDLRRFLISGVEPYDEVSRLLCSSQAQERLDRLQASLANFDQATICTIHSFCQSVLKELGILGDWDADEAVLADPSELMDQCATDVYLASYTDSQVLPFDPRRALQIASAACQTQLPLYPPEGEEASYCEKVRVEFARRKRRLGQVTFDDMPRRLHEVLCNSEVSSSATKQLRDRFRLVMVDEFQDTDRTQWELIQHTFMGDGRPTVLIGDPKQSIYGFRDADLLSYLRATDQAQKQSLGKNYRSDAGVVDGVEELFGNVLLGPGDIQVEPVAAEHGSRFTLEGSRSRIWIRKGNQDELEGSPDTAIGHDMAYLLAKLFADARIGEKPVLASDVAILVRNKDTGARLQQILHDAGIPASFPGNRSVLETRAADQWALLLKAMADPTRSNIVLAASTELLGFDLGELCRADQPASQDASLLVHELAHAFNEGGVPAALGHLETRRALRSRVVSLAGGEQLLSDLLQVAELLGAQHAPGPNQLLRWLQQAELSDSEASEDAKQRLGTDEAAVTILTMHAAKGLEFPVVFLPEVSKTDPRSTLPFQWVHGASGEGHGERMLYVGEKPHYQDRLRLAYEDQVRDEELRLLYVGLTRAQHLAVAWHVTSKRSDRGPLTALLARDRSSSRLEPRYRRVPQDPGFAPKLVTVTTFDGRQRAPAPSAAAGPAAQLSAAASSRTINQHWRRTSYSGLTAGLYETSHRLVTDEPEPGFTAEDPLAADLLVTSPMAELPAGPAFGTLVHEVLEALDWSPENLAGSASDVVSRLAPRHGLAQASADVLASALVQVCTTPLGALTGGLSLSEFPLEDRLAELDFDLPLADRGTPALLSDLAAMMKTHLGPQDPLVAYPDELLASPSASAVLEGMLTGSIDVVLRTPTGSFLVLDYKTNLFPNPEGQELMLGHYQHSAMTSAMIASHYPLQALLYSVALHRYLFWRLPGYDAEDHLGGAGYLFVRGMGGPATPVVDGTPCGVFAWTPPASLVIAASDLLGGAL